MTKYIDRTGEPDDVFEREVLARVEDPTPPEMLREQLWTAIVEVRDASPRRADDADTWDIVDAALAVFRGQQDPVAGRCLDLADRLQRGEVGRPGMEGVAFLIRVAVHDSVPAATQCASDRKAAN